MAQFKGWLMRSGWNRHWSAALLGLAAAVAAPAASAAIVTGSWDPALPDPPFVNLGWTTTINLKVDDDCSSGAQSLPFIVNVFGRSFGCRSNPFQSTTPFSILSAEIGIYDLGTERIVDVLRFDASSFNPLLLDLGTGGSIDLLFSTSDSNAVRGTVGSTDDFEFRLALPGPAPRIKYRAFGTSGSFVTAPGVPIETAFDIGADTDQARIIATTRLEIGQTVFNAVPEPASLALALLALGAAGAATAGRRGRRAPPAA